MIQPAQAGYLRLLTHARVEVLCDHLAAELRAEPLPDPFAPEWMIVPHGGFRVWLQQQMTAHLGIWAHAHLLQWPQAIWGLARGLMGDLPRPMPLESWQSVWKILAGLPELLEHPAFAAMQHWVHRAPEQSRHWALARALAQQLEMAAVYRPEQVLAWESVGHAHEFGHESDWAPVLWRFLRRDPETARHRSALRQELLHRLRQGHFRRHALPHRLTLFCPGEIPYFYQEILAALAQWLPVTVYLSEPFSPQAQAPLLTSCGEQRRLLHTALSGVKHRAQSLPETSPPTLHLLGALQQALRGVDRPGLPDGSLRLDSVHSPLRALEVLKDYLYTCFQQLPDLKADQIAVILPELESWSPLIAGVFHEQPHEPGYLPWSLFQPDHAPSPLAASLHRLLELNHGRLERGRVLALLEQTCVSQRFALSPEEQVLIGQWLEAVEVRWGLDAAHRARLDLPAFDANSWTAGLRQLLLGFSLNGQEPFADMLPYAPMEGQAVHTLGKLLDFFAFVSTTLNTLRSDRPLSEWSEVLLQVLEGLCLVSLELQPEYLALRSQILRLKQLPYTSAVNLTVIESWLREQPVSANEPVIGRLRFTRPQHVAGVPFRVVCVLGLDAGILPRLDSDTELSLLSRAPQPGDPSLCRQDRALFLELVLAARDRLYLSYTGQSIRDHQTLPPSVLIAELQETVAHSCGVQLVVQRQSLHPFAPENFQGTSWSRTAFAAAQAFQGAPPAERAFVDMQFPEPEPVVFWPDLIDFYRQPTRYFLRSRLGLRLSREGDLPADSENFLLTGLARWQVREQLLQALLAGHPPAVIPQTLALSGRLPPGALGRETLKQIQPDALALAAAIRALTDAGGEELPFDFRLGRWQVNGLLQGVCPQGLIHYRTGALRAVDYLYSWLHHVLLACLGRSEPVIRLALEGQQLQKLTFRPLADPEAELLNLLELMAYGLRAPLPLSLETAWVWIQTPDSHKAWRAAREKWTHEIWGERLDPAYALCLSADWWQSAEVQQLITRLYGPLMRHLEVST